MQRLGTTCKLTLLLALLSTVPVVALVLNQTTDQIAQQSRARLQACQLAAQTCAEHLQNNRHAQLVTTLGQLSESHEGFKSLRLVRFDGKIIHEMGEHAREWGKANETNTSISVPIIRNSRTWMSLEIAFATDAAGGKFWKVATAIAFVGVLNLVSFGLLLRRSLAVLDSSRTVPRRVKNTLDTIAGGVVITDPKGRLMMVNEAFQKSTHRTIDQLVGQSLDSMPFKSKNAQTPWAAALSTSQRQAGSTVELEVSENERRSFVVNATPILDSKEQLAGTLVSFEDVTVLERQKQTLMQTLAELEISKEQIHQQNVRLQELASKDALTGCFNRRSLIERLENDWNEFVSSKKTVNVVMLDVDHFKKLNDNYGHAVGDEVLKDVSRVIRDSVADSGFVGRYGGEEFCVILTDMPPSGAYEIAEGIRRAIQHSLAEPYHVTSSFGVSSCEFSAVSFQAMLEQADQALYAAKQAGRNQVKLWDSSMGAEEEPNQATHVPKVNLTTAQQPISYQAVASLHVALAYRDADTALHSQRVSELSVTVGRSLMGLGDLYVLEIAGLLHDIGKIGIPDSVLLKPGKLDESEWRIMEAHARIGVEIIESAFESKALSDIVRYHHYRYDGGGTPAGGPVGKDIPLGARIICMVDAYDAMVSNRVYRKGRSPEEAFAELKRCSGGQFDPDLVDQFVHMQVGWRADSRYMQQDFEDGTAITVGHLTERTVTAYEAHDVKTLAETLQRLKVVGKHLENPAIVHLSTELSKFIAGRDVDWEAIVPILQNLLEMCLTIQRAHVRDVASRPQNTLNCPQESYYARARQWESDLMDKNVPSVPQF